jgi:hypothetical protein
LPQYDHAVNDRVSRHRAREGAMHGAPGPVTVRTSFGRT